MVQLKQNNKEQFEKEKQQAINELSQLKQQQAQLQNAKQQAEGQLLQQKAILGQKERQKRLLKDAINKLQSQKEAK